MTTEPTIPHLLSEDWREAAYARAIDLYPNTGMRSLATTMAQTHRFAIEYMEQCPALPVFVARSFGPAAIRLHRGIGSIVAQRFGSAVAGGPKLRTLISQFGGPVPIRKLSGFACIPRNFKTILALRDIAPSDLAQAIPEGKGEQAAWLRFLRSWKTYNDRYGYIGTDKHRARWEWAVKAGSVAIRRGTKEPQDHVRDIFDMIERGRIDLNPAWTLQGAIDAVARWHAVLAQQQDQARFLRENGFGFEEKRDYGPLPLRAEIRGLTFTALQSGFDLFVEGRAMHHCVSSYVREVMLGATRIYSIRRGEDRIATIELIPATTGRRYRIAQLKGPCNRRVAKAVEHIAGLFVEQCNDEAAAKAAGPDWTKPEAYRT